MAVCADGCHASQKLLTLLEAVNRPARKRISILRLDVAELPASARSCGLLTGPGVALFHHGTLCFQFSGELSRQELDDVLALADRLAQKAAPMRQTPLVCQHSGASLS